MAKKGDGLKALAKETEKRAAETPSTGPDNPEFKKLNLTQAAGPPLKKGRVSDNPPVFHPKKEAPPERPQSAKPEPATGQDDQEEVTRENIAAPTQPGPDLSAEEAQKLLEQCQDLLLEFQGVARAFQRAGGGRREGSVYEAWRDLNHAQILLYRSMSLLREGYALGEE